MRTDRTRIEDEAAELPRRERARLALKLIESLDGGDDESVDELWLDESERRLKRYEEGIAEAADAEEAFSEIDRDLK